MIQKIRSNPNLLHFIAYSLSFISFGAAITGLGPLIPFLAELKHEKQTEFTLLFFWRAIGFLAASFLVKIMQKNMKIHKLLVILSILGGATLGIFSIAIDFNNYVLAGLIFFSTLFFASAQILINVAMIITHKHNDLEFWLQLNHGSFGIGGLLGPILVFQFGIYSYAAIGLFMVIACPFYIFLDSPDSAKNQVEEQNKQGKQQKQMPNICLIILSLIFFLDIGLEMTFGGWISSYTVIKGVATKEVATEIGSVFWLAMTLFRFILACIPGKSSSKLLTLSFGSFAAGMITIFIIGSGNQLFGVWFSACVLGIFYACLFPLQFALSSQFGYHLSVGQTAKIATAASLGEAGPSMVVGYLMDYFSTDMLFYSLTAIALMHCYLTYYVIKKLGQSQKMSSGKKFK